MKVTIIKFLLAFSPHPELAEGYVFMPLCLYAVMPLRHLCYQAAVARLAKFR